MTVAALHIQIDRCDAALKLFNRCMKDRKWPKIGEREAHVSREMELLRLALVEHPELDDGLADKIRYLDIKLRRIQRQLASHISAMGADVDTVERGLGQAKAAKALLQKV